MEYKTEKKGVLFVNDKKEKESQPDYSGNCEIEGVKYRIAGWKRAYKNDSSKQLLSLNFELFEEKEEVPF